MRNWDTALPRRLGVLGFRLLHGTLACNAFTFYRTWGDRRGPHAHEACCSHAACRGQQLETLTHAFLECPAVQSAVDWLLNTWQALAAGAGDQPPRDARVLLVDDHRVWAPPPNLAKLWHRLRLAVLYGIWHYRCRRTFCRGRSLAALATRMAVDTLQRCIQRDWRRVVGVVRRVDYF